MRNRPEKQEKECMRVHDMWATLYALNGIIKARKCRDEVSGCFCAGEARDVISYERERPGERRVRSRRVRCRKESFCESK